MKTNQMLIYGVGILLLLVFTGYLKLPAAGAPGAIGGAAPVGIEGCTLSTTQTVVNSTVNAWKPGTAVATNSYVYSNPDTGTLNPGTLTTTPGQTVTVYSYASGYCTGVGKLTTGCIASPTIQLQSKQVDTALSLTAYDNNGITALSDGVQNLTMGSGGSATAHIKIAQSAAYKDISCSQGKFAVFVNATNVTDFAPAQMSIVFDGKVCTPYGQAGLSNSATPAALKGVVIYGAVCEGGFAANDGSIHELSVKYNAASGVDPGIQFSWVNIIPVDFYRNSISGAVEVGAVTDAGAAIQANQPIVVPLD